MTLRKMIDGSVVGLRIAEESTDIGVLGGSPIWLPQEPNSYGDFGVEITTLARNPIAEDRQAKKGMVVDLAAGGGFVSDFTQINVQEPLQGFFFADLRRQAEFGNGTGVITSVTTSYNAASGLTFAINDLIFGSGFNTSANNGFKTATAASGTAVTAAGLIAEAAPPATARIVKVGQLFGAGVLDITTAGALPAMTGTGMPVLTPGSWVFLGGDAVGTKFVNAGNNGFKRLRTSSATLWEFDKSLTTMVTEASTTETIQVFIPRSLKNEVGALIKRRTYQLEQTLGAPDNASPSQVQSQYLIGCVANTMSLSIGVADKVTVELGYMGLNGETRTGVVGVKSGSRPELIEQDAFNTSSDFTFMRVSTVQTSGANSTALFGFLTQCNLNVNNNAEAAKAIGVLGGFDITVGKFQVDGEIEAYFTDVAALEAVKANGSVTLDMAMVKNGRGVVVDVPLITLGNARLNIEQDKPIKIPCNFNAASGAQVHPNLDHTLYMGFFDFLPLAAE
jgi:tail tube protein